MILHAERLTMVFSGRTVLDEFDLTLDAGEHCALTGRSGSGKTTLLLILATLLRPTTGRVDLRLPARDVVYVPQAPSLVAELTAVQNASLGLRIRGIKPADALERARGQLRALGLDDDVDHALPAELSGGMQQRVALARALAIGPKLLLADEPTGALDQATGSQVVEVLRTETLRSGAALIVATHDPLVAGRFGRRLTLQQEIPV
jgi:putative ABC transport system ATP-binding protein